MFTRYVLAWISGNIFLLVLFPPSTDVAKWGCSASDVKSIYPLNDDYCDDRKTGSDEHNSSACSFFSRGVHGDRSVFKCVKSASLDGTMIPLSRVQVKIHVPPSLSP